MKTFGGLTLKPTLILGNPWVRLLQRTKPANFGNDVELVKKSIDKNGVRRVTGTKKLKESQEYPAGFGHAVANHFLTSFSEAHVMADFIAE